MRRNGDWRVWVTGVALSLPVSLFAGVSSASSLPSVDGSSAAVQPRLDPSRDDGPNPTSEVSLVTASVSEEFPREVAGSRLTASGEVIVLVKGKASQELADATRSTSSIHFSEGHLFSLADQERMAGKTAKVLADLGIKNAGFAVGPDAISISLTRGESRGRVETALRQAMSLSDSETLEFEGEAASSRSQIYEDAFGE